MHHLPHPSSPSQALLVSFFRLTLAVRDQTHNHKRLEGRRQRMTVHECSLNFCDSVTDIFTEKMSHGTEVHGAIQKQGKLSIR
jgi:hypothetical protein